MNKRKDEISRWLFGIAGDEKTYMQSGMVVDQGLYAITRHPQYLDYIFLACGFALLSGHWAPFLFAFAGFSFFYLQAVREEAYCLAQFGEPYAEYLLRVPRFNIILGVWRVLRKNWAHEYHGADQAIGCRPRHLLMFWGAPTRR